MVETNCGKLLEPSEYRKTWNWLFIEGAQDNESRHARWVCGDVHNNWGTTLGNVAFCNDCARMAGLLW